MSVFSLFNLSGRAPKEPERLYQEAREGDLHAVRDLLARGWEPDAPGEDGRRAVHAGAFWGHPDILSALKNHRADLFIKDNKKRSIFHAAAMGYNGRRNVFIWVFSSLLGIPVSTAARVLEKPDEISKLSKDKAGALKQLCDELDFRAASGKTALAILKEKSGHEAEKCHSLAEKLEAFLLASRKTFQLSLVSPAPAAAAKKI